MFISDTAASTFCAGCCGKVIIVIIIELIIIITIIISSSSIIIIIIIILWEGEGQDGPNATPNSGALALHYAAARLKKTVLLLCSRNIFESKTFFCFHYADAR